MFLKKAISALEVESLQLCFSSERNARAQFGKGGEQCQFTVLGRSEELRGELKDELASECTLKRCRF